jgi:hypothetical protein
VVSRSKRNESGNGAPASRFAAPGIGGERLVAALAACAVFLGGALFLYRPAFDGPFISDDAHYVRDNLYVPHLTLTNVRDVLDPGGPLLVLIENYAPVHILLHAVVWQVFQEDVRGHHVVNVLFHVAASLLLVLWFRGLGLPPPLALAGGAIFLVHPASVEAVAWISQLKTTSSMVLVLGALLLRPGRPLLAAILFGLSLLAKPTAAFALPVAALAEWVHGAGATFSVPGPAAAAARKRWIWIGVWAAIFVVFAVVEFGAFHVSAGNAPLAYPDPWVRFRTASEIALRYGVMAASGYGLAAFHEPPPATSWLDPWWLASVPVLLAMGIRALVTLRRRSPEAICWLWVGASWVPISQLFPFPFSMGDRYLYFILPGLIGVLLLGVEALLAHVDRFREQSPDGARTRGLAYVPGALAALAAAWLIFLAVQSHERARLWGTPNLLMAHSAARYPEGSSAALLRSRRAAQLGDERSAVAELRKLADRGWNRFDILLQDAAYLPIRDGKHFQALLRDMAQWWIDRIEERESPAQMGLHLMAVAHELRGEDEAALRALERAVEVGGPADERMRQELARMRAKVARRNRGPSGEGNSR